MRRNRIVPLLTDITQCGTIGFHLKDDNKREYQPPFSHFLMRLAAAPVLYTIFSHVAMIKARFQRNTPLLSFPGAAFNNSRFAVMESDATRIGLFQKGRAHDFIEVFTYRTYLPC